VKGATKCVRGDPGLVTGWPSCTPRHASLRSKCPNGGFSLDERRTPVVRFWKLSRLCRSARVSAPPVSDEHLVQHPRARKSIQSLEHLDDVGMAHHQADVAMVSQPSAARDAPEIRRHASAARQGRPSTPRLREPGGVCLVALLASPRHANSASREGPLLVKPHR